MLPRRIKISANINKSIHHHHISKSFSFIEKRIIVTYINAPQFFSKTLSKRQFSILSKEEKNTNIKEEKDESKNVNTNESKNDEITATTNAQHIEVHAFRSLITIAQEPDKLNAKELSLSFTERTALSHIRSQTENDSIPAIAYEIWNNPPEIYDIIYGFEADCEPPSRYNLSWIYLYKLWGYYTEREIRYRCSLYIYMKSQRRCSLEIFWNIFELENTFRVELQLLCLHIWFTKIKMITDFGINIGNKLCYKTFKIFFEQLPNRFGQHLNGIKSKWEQDCQQACLHFAISLDHAKEDYDLGDKNSFNKVIWNELYLSNKDINYDLLYLWTEYILQEINHLNNNVTKNEFLNGWWKFGKIPDINDRIKIRKDIIDKYNDNNDNNDNNNA